MKNIETKAYEAMVNAFRDRGFRDTEFNRLIVEGGYGKDFFHLAMGYLAYLSVYAKYDYYPYGLEDESNMAREIILEHFDPPLDS